LRVGNPAIVGAHGGAPSVHHHASESATHVHRTFCGALHVETVAPETTTNLG
jgi:hypothetical protein